jgi:PIN domain nuclease of toxin-antitoxin system
MRLLLDTHAFLWWLRDDRRLSAAARGPIADRASLVFVSAASIWEAAIQSHLGRLEVAADLVSEIAANGFTELPVTGRHAQRAGALPVHQRDPFDRMLVAQAQLEGLTLVTRDPAFKPYDVAVL